jgi:hypothetical protein
MSIRELFTFGGMWAGIITMWYVQRRVHPEPAYVWLFPLHTMIGGLAIGLMVQRRRRTNAKGS